MCQKNECGVVRAGEHMLKSLLAFATFGDLNGVYTCQEFETLATLPAYLTPFPLCAHAPSQPETLFSRYAVCPLQVSAFHDTTHLTFRMPSPPFLPANISLAN